MTGDATPPTGGTAKIDGGRPVAILAPFPAEGYWDWRLRMERAGGPDAEQVAFSLDGWAEGTYDVPVANLERAGDE